MREGSPSLSLMTTTLPTTRPPKPLPTRAVGCASRAVHCSLVSKASLGESLMGPPPECLSSVHITHAHSALAIADKASTVSAAITEARRSRIIALLSPDHRGTCSYFVPIAPRPLGLGRMACTNPRRLSSAEELADAAGHAVEETGLYYALTRTDAESPHSL